MTNYRRAFVAGGAYFFTVNLADRRSGLLIGHIELLRAAFRYARVRHPFALEAIVVLPDHMHAIWRLPESDADFPLRWRLIKAAFSRSSPAQEPVSPSRLGKGERGIWQRRYWEHAIRDHRDSERHFDYIHFNPVKHGYVHRVGEWPYSSFHRFVRLGMYPEEWAGDAGEGTVGFGERESGSADRFRRAQPILQDDGEGN